MFFSKPAAVALGLAWLVSSLLTTQRVSVEVPVEALIPTQTQAVLTIVLRDSLGHSLEGVLTEVLSYDWGMPIGQPYGIIARGETDKNGVVAFDSTLWPFSGYRLKFTPTNHTRPGEAYFLPDDQNQYRGYPGISTGGVTETQKFVLSGSDGLIYNDLSAAGELPQYQRDPVGGMLNPRVSVMPGQDFVATALAATTTAEARGEPTPTFPPAPAASPRPGQVQAPLTVTPDVQTTAAAAPVTTTTATTQPTSVAAAAIVTSPPPVAKTAASTATAPAAAAATARPATTNQAVSQQSKSGTDLFGSIALAVIGIVALVTFWIFRFKIYSLLGIESSPENRKTLTLNGTRQPDRPKVKQPKK